MTTNGEPLDLTTSVNSLYMLLCTSLLPLVVIGVALFYSGLTQRRSALTMFAVPILTSPMIIIDWFIWGYSLCFSEASNEFIGNLNYVVLRQIQGSFSQEFTNTRGSVLIINHFLFNMLFKVICCALTFPGCIAERGRIMPMLLFVFVWSVIIYNPVTYWFWSENGWLARMHVLDFAGGNCIHIVSGFTCLAYSYILGPRNPKLLSEYRHSNTGYIIVGTFLVFFGWIGFMAGCDFRFSYNSVFIMFSTVLAACSGAIVWTAIDYMVSSVPLGDGALSELDLPSSQSDSGKEGDVEKTETETKANTTAKTEAEALLIYGKRKFSMVSFSSGVMAGLVAFTPGGGYITSNSEFWKPIVFGVVGAAACNLATRLKYYFRIDDALDIFAMHGVTGIVGSLLTGLFANQLYDSQGGWIVRHWKQFGYQLLGVVVTSAYVFVLSCVFLYLIDIIPGLHLRIDKNYNRRNREKKQRMLVRDDEVGLSISPKQQQQQQQQQQQNQHYLVESEEVDVWEQMELNGSDAYEFTDEYMMDFIEFIKVLRPSDYEEEAEVEDFLSPKPNYTSGVHSGYQLHSGHDSILQRRE
ncbi:uncharacterized protein LODBEIA_P02340 [Lodderomyces beijingensis]|uniref:Ammonium transporter AmtB-like domain-containing protein n=1 Tax=Lodderomyces beijingensis TaxID=1775926 RepID=A0ABP0ZCV9_9ASCO